MEKTIKEVEISIKGIIVNLITEVIAIVILTILYNFIKEDIPKLLNILIVLMLFFWFIYDILPFFTTKLKITNKRIIGKIGSITVNEIDSPLNKINAIQIKQTFLGNMFNYGTIVVTTASSMFEFKYINNPYEIKEIINNEIENYEAKK